MSIRDESPVPPVGDIIREVNEKDNLDQVVHHLTKLCLPFVSLVCDKALSLLRPGAHIRHRGQIWTVVYNDGQTIYILLY